MIRVRFDPATLEGSAAADWQAWELQAGNAKAAIAEQQQRREEPTFRDAVAKKLKELVLEHVFHNKCGYCERIIDTASAMDHWRPKKAVTRRENGRVVAVSRDGRPHTGYWWVAYDWTNLVPACSLCNSGNGKNCQFPIAGRYAFTPDEAPDVDALDALEQPLLLHPLRGPDPADHLLFTDEGSVRAMPGSDHGRYTVQVCDLDSTYLQRRRKARCSEAREGFRLVMLAHVFDGVPYEEAAANWIGQRAEFSAAVRQFLNRYRREIAAEVAPD